MEPASGYEFNAEKCAGVKLNDLSYLFASYDVDTKNRKWMTSKKKDVDANIAKINTNLKAVYKQLDGKTPKPVEGVDDAFLKEIREINQINFNTWWKVETGFLGGLKKLLYVFSFGSYIPAAQINLSKLESIKKLNEKVSKTAQNVLPSSSSPAPSPKSLSSSKVSTSSPLTSQIVQSAASNALSLTDKQKTTIDTIVQQSRHKPLANEDEVAQVMNAQLSSIEKTVRNNPGGQFYRIYNTTEHPNQFILYFFTLDKQGVLTERREFRVDPDGKINAVTYVDTQSKRVTYNDFETYLRATLPKEGVAKLGKGEL